MIKIKKIISFCKSCNSTHIMFHNVNIILVECLIFLIKFSEFYKLWLHVNKINLLVL
jgi:hypothetical protein